ncbi:MAG: hypothetical protein JNJ59_07380 [Deltaproteobacteria bacterium]|nr:hypothetical protein [Deltaproteobacteria bacterium]
MKYKLSWLLVLGLGQQGCGDAGGGRGVPDGTLDSDLGERDAEINGVDGADADADGADADADGASVADVEVEVPDVDAEGDGFASEVDVSEPETCVDHATRCGETPELCVSGRWVAFEPCLEHEVCSEGICVGRCTEREERCVGSVPQTCVSGSWRDHTPCGEEEVCKEGRCAPLIHRFAVIVDDSQIFPYHRATGTNPCATASHPLYAHGADIDAVGLFDGSTLLGYLVSVDYREGGICSANNMSDPTLALGAPDGKVGSGFVSLGGGWLAGEFAEGVEIRPGHTLVVYEVGTHCAQNVNCGAVDEGYEVFVATDLGCARVGAGYPYASCAARVSALSKGEAAIPLSGF